MAKESNRFAHHADRRRYEQIIDRYLADCYAQRTAARVSELAELLTAPQPYLSETITQLFGKPLHRILSERRLEEACRLLRVPDLPLEVIAVASAFGTSSTFYRQFRKAFGMTPDEYRRQLTDCDTPDGRRQATK